MRDFSGSPFFRFEERHLLRAFLCAAQRRVRLHVEEDRVLNAHLVQFVGNGLRVACGIQEIVGDEEGALTAGYTFSSIVFSL